MAETAGADSTPRRLTLTWWFGMAAVALTAVLTRLLPVLAGGGLYGQGNYDDGVYYTAAAGFVHGLMPYRDFLLLHPPGIMLALAPFAELAHWLGEPNAFAVARVSFMLLGAANAVLVGVVLRRLSAAAAIGGAMLYAVFYPSVYVEHTTMLEPLATTCLLSATALIAHAYANDHRRARVWAPLAVAGTLLGLSASIKIWGVAPALAVAGWVLVVLGWRRAAQLLAGFAAGVTAVCLPFFIAAPGQMWHLVVLSQLGRPASYQIWARTATIVGLTPFGTTPRWAIALAVVVVAACCLAAVATPVGRLSLVLLASTLAVLYAAPSWFQHYAGFSAGPLALVVGCGIDQVARRVRRPATAAVSAFVVAALLCGSAIAVVTKQFGQPFPTAALREPVAAAQGCVTTDDPISLIELDTLRRNLDRDCSLVADLGGYNYAIQVGTTAFRTRAKNPQWQSLALKYLRSGEVSVVGIRFKSGYGYSKTTAAQVNSWPLVAKAGEIAVRTPTTQLSVR